MHEFTYTYDTLLKISGQTSERLRQDISRGDLIPESLASVAVWLADNGMPRLRAEMAKRLIPPVLGTTRRDLKANKELQAMASGLDIVLAIFQRDQQARRTRSKKISKGREGK